MRGRRATAGTAFRTTRPVLAIAVAGAVLLGSGTLMAGRAGQTNGSPAAAAASSVVAAQHRDTLARYCVSCHNERTKTAGLALDAVDWSALPEHAGPLEQVVRKLRAGMMPPPGAPRPDDSVLESLAGWLEDELDRAWNASPDPGRPLLHRLNQAEYAAAIRDLLHLEIDAATLLPPDDSSYGFDNIADVLRMSPALMERYLSAARHISALAVGDPSIESTAHTYRVRHDASQNRHVEGMPLGTIGGVRASHYFPLDGDYTFQVRLSRTNLDAIRGLQYPSAVEIAIDGKRVFLEQIGGDADLKLLFDNPAPNSDLIEERLRVTLPVTAGPHEVTAAFLEKPPVGDSLHLQSFVRSSADPLDFTGWPHVDSLIISGPANATGPGDTPSRRRIFVCRPASPTEEDACAERIVRTLARRAYRGMVTDADVARLLDFHRRGRARGSFDAGIQMALRRLLASPKFLNRAEREPDGRTAGVAYPLDDLELASRLSFFLWSSIPDDELLDAAEQGRLRTGGELEGQVRRMLADPKADALIRNFAGQWLHLRNLSNIVPHSELFPDFDDNLRRALRRETELFVGSILREDRSVLELLTSTDSFLNERLARHYGIRGIYGSHFRKVTMPPERTGLLGKGAVLLVTSHTDRTSPVLRGKWILENILGMPPPPPPAVVPALEPTDGTRPRSMREQIDLHRASPVCASCHRLMDPLGLALENFDAVGAWRVEDAGQPIDPSTVLANGVRIESVEDLRDALAAQPEIFVRTLAEKLLTYALGRGLRPQDMPTVRRITREAAAADFRFSAIVLAIAKSNPFRMRVSGG